MKKKIVKVVIANISLYSKYALCCLLLYNMSVFSLESENAYFKDLRTKSSKFQLKAKQLAKDAKTIKKNLWKIKSNFAKKELDILLHNIKNKQKESAIYPVDIYFSTKYKYNFDQKKSISLPVELILSILANQISNAKIVRINKIKFTSFGKNGSIVTSEFDNSFVDLRNYSEFATLSKLKNILLTSIIDGNKKQSLEWIWGRSINDDAYFSTKLTLFKGNFTIYPIYRTYIGVDSFRDKNSWFFDLTTYNQDSYKNKNRLLHNLTKKQKDNSLLYSKAGILKQTISLNKNKKDSTSLVVKQVISLNKNKKDSAALVVKQDIDYSTLLSNLDSILKPNLTKQLDLFYYSKINKKHILTLEGKKSLSEISNYLLNDKNKDFVIKSVNIKIPSLPTSLIDFINLETVLLKNHNQQNYFKFKENVLSVLNKEQQIKFKKNIIKLYLSSAIKKEKRIERSSIEIIFNKKYKSQRYYATVVTIFGDQITIFEDYSKIAPITDLKDKNSWLFEVPLKLK